MSASPHYFKLMILNTTFHIDPQIKDEFLLWAADYMRQATEKELKPRLMLVHLPVMEHEHECLSYALHLEGSDRQIAAWEDNPQPQLLRALADAFGQRALPVSVRLQEVEL